MRFGNVPKKRRWLIAVVASILLVVAVAGGVIAYWNAEMCREHGCPDQQTRDFAGRMNVPGYTKISMYDSNYGIEALYIGARGQDPLSLVVAPGVSFRPPEAQWPDPERDLIGIGYSAEPAWAGCAVQIYRVLAPGLKTVDRLSADLLARVTDGPDELIVLYGMCGQA